MASPAVLLQKDAPISRRPGRRRVYSRDTERDIAYLVVDDVEMLPTCQQRHSIHLWASRIPSLERPDWLVLDLDPKGAPFTDVVRVALALRRILERLELPSYVKTSGATGLHILLPLGARYTYEQCRTFARLLAVMGVEAGLYLDGGPSSIRARGNRSISTSADDTADHRRLFAAAAARPPRPARSSGAGDSRLDPRASRSRPCPLRQDGDPLRGAGRQHRHPRRAGRIERTDASRESGGEEGRRPAASLPKKQGPRLLVR
jgi:hypothetical protein